MGSFIIGNNERTTSGLIKWGLTEAVLQHLLIMYFISGGRNARDFSSKIQLLMINWVSVCQGRRNITPPLRQAPPVVRHAIEYSNNLSKWQKILRKNI